MNAITGFEKQGTHKTVEVVCNNTEDEDVLFQQEGLYNNCWKNKTLSHVLQAPGKPWGFYVPHIALPTGKDNLFFPTKPLLMASKLERIPQQRNVLFPFGYSTAMYILSNLV